MDENSNIIAYNRIGHNSTQAQRHTHKNTHATEHTQSNTHTHHTTRTDTDRKTHTETQPDTQPRALPTCYVNVARPCCASGSSDGLSFLPQLAMGPRASRAPSGLRSRGSHCANGALAKGRARPEPIWQPTNNETRPHGDAASLT